MSGTRLKGNEMTLGAGSLAFRRLQLLSPAQLSVSQIIEKAQQSRIKPLVFDESQEESMGFCHPFRGDPDFEDGHSLVTDNCLVLGFRKDTKKIPGVLFRLQLKSALESLSAKTAAQAGAGAEGGKKPRLSKAFREQAKDRIRQELLSRTLPSIRLVEWVWNLETHEIWLLSTSDSVYGEFEKLFWECFQIPFCLLGPGTASLPFQKVYRGLRVDFEQHLQLVPQDFFGDHSNSSEPVADSKEKAGATTSAVVWNSGRPNTDQEAPF